MSGGATRGHIKPILFKLHWLPVAARVQFKVLVLIYKALNGLGPGYLEDHILPYEPTRQLRSNQGALLKELSLKEVRGMSCRQRAVSAAAPRLWNTIPIEICLALMLKIFRCQAKPSCSRRLLIEIISTVGPGGNF